MVQTLEAKIEVPIPTGYVLVKESRLIELESNEVKGYWWGLQDVLNRINRKRSWFMANVLENPRWRKKMDVENGGFVYFPKSKGDKYLFHPSRTIDFLENNFVDIMKEGKK